MYIYFNKLGKATTILPHGQVARQGGDLDLFIAMDVDFDPTNKLVEFYYKRPGDKYFSPSGTQLLLLNDGNKLEFKKNEDETYTYDLKDGEKYYTYYKHFDSNNPITAVAGTVEIVIRIYKSSPNENSDIYSVNTLDIQGLTKIFVEKTLGYSIETEFFTNPQSQSINLNMWNNLQDSFAEIHENIRCLTEEEVERLWNEVKEEENENPTMNGVKPIAENIKYNNSISGLDATTVQEAIDKVNEKIGSGSEIDYSEIFKYKGYIGIVSDTNEQLNNLETGAYSVEGFYYKGKKYDGTLLNIKLDESNIYYTQILFEGYNYENNNTLNRRIFYRHCDSLNQELIDWTILSESNPKKDKNFAKYDDQSIQVKHYVPKIDLLLTTHTHKKSKGMRMRGKDIWGSKYGNSLSVATISKPESEAQDWKIYYEDLIYNIFGFQVSKLYYNDDKITILNAFPKLRNSGHNYVPIGIYCITPQFGLPTFQTLDKFTSFIENNAYYYLASRGYRCSNCDFNNDKMGIYKMSRVFNRRIQAITEATEGSNYYLIPTRFMIKFVKDYEEVSYVSENGEVPYWEGNMANYWLEVQMCAELHFVPEETSEIRYLFRCIEHKF